MRRAAKVDSVQAEIVEGLRKAGYWVEVIGRPVDLLVGRLWEEAHLETGEKKLGATWYLLEVKTPTKTGKRRKRKDQEEQNKFIAETGTSVVTSLEQALEALRGL